MVMFYVEGLETFTKKNFIFDVTDYLNFEGQIYGLKVPESYEGVLQNLRNLNEHPKEDQYLEYSEFRQPSQPPPPQEPQQPTEEPFQQFKFPSMVNSIKDNFDFFKNQGNMEFSHQTINKDFGNPEKMQELRSSRVDSRVINLELTDLINTNGFTTNSKPLQLTI